MKTGLAVSSLALALAAGSANAAFFSFASDTADQAWTFMSGHGAGMGNMIHDGTGPNDPLVLHIDDNNGPAPHLAIPVQFDMMVSLNYVGSVQITPGYFSHNYVVSGSFMFVDVNSGAALLTVGFDGGLFTARGDATSWYSTGALQVDQSPNSSVNFVWGGGALPQYGLLPGPLTGAPRGFAFDLTAINTSGLIPYNNTNPGVAIDPQTKIPTSQWWSEGSFSANAYVPAPGALALLGLGGLAMARRRR